MKAIAALLLLSVVVGAWAADEETFSADFSSSEGVAREVQSVAVARNPELAIPAMTVQHLPAQEAEAAAATEQSDEEEGEQSEQETESFAEIDAEPAPAVASPAPPVPPVAGPTTLTISTEVADIVRKVAAVVTLIPAVPGSAAAVAAVAAPGAPPAPAGAARPASAAAAASPGAIPAAGTPVPAAGAIPPAPPAAVAPPPPKPAPKPSNPMVKRKDGKGGKKKKNTNAPPPMAGPPLPDVSAKQLRRAQVARTKAELMNRKLRSKLKNLRKQLRRRIRIEREKCAGKCPRNFPITVGPHHILSTQTRRVVVEGDRERNKQRWQSVKTHKRLLWDPKKLSKVYKYHDKTGKRIRGHHQFLKKIRAAPLVERKGKFLVTNWKDYDVMKEFP